MAKIMEEIDATQGKPVISGGILLSDDKLANKANVS